MVAYLIIDIDIHDEPGFEDYRNAVPVLAGKHGGECLARGGQFEVLDGDWQPHRLVLFRFPDRAAIRDFFDDKEYAALLALKTANGRRNHRRRRWHRLIGIIQESLARKYSRLWVRVLGPDSSKVLT